MYMYPLVGLTYPEYLKWLKCAFQYLKKLLGAVFPSLCDAEASTPVGGAVVMETALQV